MAYIGRQPTAAALTASDITDGIITKPKLADAIDAVNYKNILINGDMQIAQRATSTASITTGAYHTIDRIETILSGLGTWTQSQDTDVPTGQGFATSLKMDNTTADGSPSAGDYCIFRTKFEGQNLQHLKKGTASAESLTLSFWVKSVKTGTFIAELYDYDTTRSISKSYTVDSGSTWEQKEITFAGDTTGAFGNDNALSLAINFWLGAGTTYSSGTLATSWASITAANRAVGQVNLADSDSNNFWITGVQLEVGTSASDFEFLPYDVNLRRCERYYASSFEIGQLPALDLEKNIYRFTRPYDATNHSGIGTSYPTTMRTTPSVTTYTSSASAGTTGQITVYTGSWGAVSVNIDATSTQNQFSIYSALGSTATLVQYNYTADAEL